MSAANGWEVTSALAPDFVWVSSLPDLTLSFPAGPSPVTVSVTNGTYRILLAPSAADFLQVAQTKINLSMVAAGRAETFVLGLDEDGRAILSISAGTWSATLGPLLTVLGWLTAPAAVASSTAEFQPRYLILSCCAYDGVWEPAQDGATEVTAAGQVFSLASTQTHFHRELQLDKIPLDPTRATDAASPATPMYPDVGYYHLIGNTAVVRAWSILDVLRWCRNADTGLTLGDFQDLRSSTSTRYLIGRVATVLSPKIEREDAKWPRFVRHALGFVLPSTAHTGTRA